MKQTYFKLLILSSLFISQISFGQIPITITKVTDDSISIEFPTDMNLEMNKPYKFIIKTNITEKDKLFKNFSDAKITNDLIIEFTFNYHEFSFDIARYNRKKEATLIKRKMLYIKGTKYIVKLDGTIITRHKPNTISPASKIEIELVSESENTNSLKVTDPIILYWMDNHDSYKKIYLEQLKASVDLSKEPQLKTGKTMQKFNYLVLVLPQVFNWQKSLLPESQQERIYIMMYKE